MLNSTTSNVGKEGGENLTIRVPLETAISNPPLFLLSFDNALIRFKQILTKNHQSFDQNNFYINNKRYAIMTIENERCLIAFKREFFLTYGNYYPNEDSKLGETINREDLREAIGKQRVTRLIYLYEDGRIYTVQIKHLPNHWHLRVTSNEDKEEYCFNIKHLHRWE